MSMQKIVFLSALLCVASATFAQSFVEDFEVGPAAFLNGSNLTFGNTAGGDAVALGSGNWFALNASTPIGFTGWYNNPNQFAPHAGAGLLNANYNAVAGANLINSFFMSPVRTFSNGDTISFWSRTLSNPAAFADRLNLKLSTSGSATTVASFSTNLLTINPVLTPTGYPNVWTQYTVALSLPAPLSGRLAFHYDVLDGGLNGSQSDFIGIDDVAYTRAGLTESFDTSTTPGFIDSSNRTFGNSPGGNDIVFPSGTWRAVNASSPLGTRGWFNGTFFPARSGPGQVSVDWNNTTGANTINSYMMSPVRAFANGDQIRFWTRGTGPGFPERLNLRLSTDGPSTSPAAFTRVLLTINPLLTGPGYPSTWTEFTGVVSGLPAPALGRFAFHYDITNGGPLGANGDIIGIDDVRHIPAPASQNLTGIVGLADTGSFAPGVTRTLTYSVRQGTTVVAAGILTASGPEVFYTIPVPFAVNGACTITFDGSSFLKKNKPVTLDGSNQNVGGSVMLNGDVDKSGEVDAADIDAVIAAFGNTFPGMGNPDTDVDVSGEVDAADIDIVISNFGGVDE